MPVNPDPEYPNHRASRGKVMRKGRRWRVLHVLVFVVGSVVATVAGAEASALPDQRPRIELYAGAAEILDTGENPWNVGLGYIWEPMGGWGIAPGVGVMYAEHNASSFYGELQRDFRLGRQWVITPKFAAGIYSDDGGLELGNEFMFREGVVLSWVGPRFRLGIGFYHASNGGLGENNPGTEVLEVVLGFPVGIVSK